MNGNLTSRKPRGLGERFLEMLGSRVGELGGREIMLNPGAQGAGEAMRGQGV